MSLGKKNLTLLILILCMIAIGSFFTSSSAQTFESTYLPFIEAPFTPTVFGVSMYSIDPPGGLEQIADAQISWTRREFPWKAVEPIQGQRNWSAVASFEQELINANANHLEVILVLHYTPAWAEYPGVTCDGKVAQEKFNALAAFMYDLVSRYSQPPYNVSYWELWNEPDVEGALGCWGDSTDPYYGGRYYGEMLKTVYPAIKAADPTAQVMVGGLLLDCNPNNPPSGRVCTSSKFLEGVLVTGAGNAFDGVSFHAYDYYEGNHDYSNSNWQASRETTGPVTLVKSAYIRSLLNAFGASNKFLMNTEIALVCGSDTNPGCPDSLNEETKAFYIAHAFAASIADGYRGSIWFSAIDDRYNSLLNPNLSPLPGYNAITIMREELGHYEFVRPLALGSGLMGYAFEKGPTIKWVIWSRDNNSHLITLPETPNGVIEIIETGFSNPLPVASSYTIERYPVIIEFTQ